MYIYVYTHTLMKIREKEPSSKELSVLLKTQERSRMCGFFLNLFLT